MSSSITTPEGIINPPIDELLEATDSKYSLVIYAAKRARQINAYYSQLGEGLLEYVGPLVDTHVHEKPLSIALREINAGLLTSEAVEGPAAVAARPQHRTVHHGPGSATAGPVVCHGVQVRRRVDRCADAEDAGARTSDGAARAGPGSSWEWAAASPRTRRASCCGGSPSPGTTSGSCRPRPRCASSARPPGPRSPATPWPPRSGTPSTRCRTCASGRRADLVVVAPATADLLARAAHGLADDLLTNTLLTARCPVVFAPAMHTEMWEHPATRENVATLRRRGAVVIEPAVGRLTGVDTGKGRLPDPDEIFEVCRRVLARGAAAARAGPRRAARGGQRGRHPRAAGPGALPGQPLVGQAGLRAGPYGRGARRPGHPGRRQHRACRTRRGGRGAGRHGRAAARGRAARPRPTPTPW